MRREIERADWPSFFESFTLQHDAWLVTVGNVLALPLEGIIARDDEIVITVGRDMHDHRRIVISNPLRVHLDQQGGVDEGVDIESRDGRTTRLRFRSPMPPELVDGIA
ncbi:MAG: hypothetical protein QOH21_3175 [Acidobacteriota bacterium]|jgi:hypothetical protein|nr:hypothetical protein [Acidobacteriota bacterium]